VKRNSAPSDTPAGTLTWTGCRTISLPVPPQVRHSSAHDSPRPPQVRQTQHTGTSSGSVAPRHASYGDRSIQVLSGEDRSAATKALRIRSTAGAIDGKSIATSSPNRRESSCRSSAARTTTESPPEGRKVMPDMAQRVP